MKKIDGVACREHDVEFTWELSGTEEYNAVLLERGERIAAEHTATHGNSCKIERIAQ